MIYKRRNEISLGNKKILDPSISVQATCARVPVFNGHSEAVFLVKQKLQKKKL